MDLISKEMWDKMPSKNEFNARLMRLGIMDEDGNVDESRIEELSDIPNDQLQ